MLARRRFAACALCAVTGLVASKGEAQAPGFTRTILRQVDYPDDKHAVIQVLVEIEPNVLVARHTHPGIETAYVLEGSSLLSVHGMADRTIGAGEGFQVPKGVPHAVKNGAAKSRVLAIYTVEKGQPLASPAPE